MSGIKIVRPKEANSSWQEIARQIDKGNNGFLNVGDEIKCTLKDGKEVTIVVLHLNAYQEGVIFGLKDIYSLEPWNREDTNAGWWKACHLREWCNTELLNLLPDELADVITPRRIVQKCDGVTEESTDKIWIPSKTETIGNGNNTSDYGDVQFDFFKDNRSRVKFLDGETCSYALRSPRVSHSTDFWLVSHNGYCYSDDAGNYNAVYPCFSIFKHGNITERNPKKVVARKKGFYGK